MRDTQERKLPPMPHFANEAEEAQWWFDHREELAEDMLAAAQQGKLGVGTAARRANEAAKIALDPEDVERAWVQAERRGLEYQAYVKMVVHRALLMEEKKKKSA
jgi:predicted DNA binding CopG/RHH family protein